jgi:hypothetical protein
MERDKGEMECKGELAHQLKLIGDAMKGPAYNMTNDPIDLVPLISHIEQLFSDFKTKPELQVKLLRPYSNERAKILVARLDVIKSNNVEFVKQYLLHEFQLLPKAHLELDRFNSINKAGDETFLSFASKLKGLIDFYMTSRKVIDFGNVVSLVIRMKDFF